MYLHYKFTAFRFKSVNQVPYIEQLFTLPDR